MKERWFTLCLLIIGVIAVMSTPIYAFTPPGQGSDNATDVIIWYGDNLTIESATANVTLIGFNATMMQFSDDIIDSYETALDTTIDDAIAKIVAYAITFIFTILAYTRREPLIKIIAGFMLMFLGFDYWDTNWTIAFLIGIAGIYTFIRAFLRTSDERKTE